MFQKRICACSQHGNKNTPQVQKICHQRNNQKVMLWHHHPPKLEPLIGCENTSCKRTCQNLYMWNLALNAVSLKLKPPNLQGVPSLPCPRHLQFHFLCGQPSPQERHRLPSEWISENPILLLGHFLTSRFFWASNNFWQKKSLFSRLSKAPISGE